MPRLLVAVVVITISTPAFADTRMGIGLGPEGALPAQARIFDLSPAVETDLRPYAAGYGARVAFGDVTSDAKDELLTGPGPGPIYGPQFRAFRRDGSVVSKVNFYAYGTLRFGVDPAGVDLDLPAAMAGGIADEMVSGAGPGAVFGPHVRAFALGPSGVSALGRVNFFAYNTLKYGVGVGGADFDGDLHEEILTTPGPSPVFGPDVRAWSFATGSVQSLFAASPGTGGYGARAAGGDLDADGFAELTVSAGPDPAASGSVSGFDWGSGVFTALFSFDPYPVGVPGSRLALGHLNGDGAEELLTAPGGPAAGLNVKGFSWDGSSVIPISSLDFAPFASSSNVIPAVSDTSYEFDPGFLWGTATAAHQVEGGNVLNDWYEWEQLGMTLEPSGAACEEYTRYDQDFALAQSLSHDVHRFSIEWSRIEPQRDVWDMSEVAHYHQVLDALIARGIKPLLTIHHFTNPQWILSPANPATDLDGWESQETEDEFVEFAAFVAAEYGSKVDVWTTINEPTATILSGYLIGAFPPGRVLDIPAAQAAALHMAQGHARAYDAIHAADTVDADGDGVAASVSIAHHTRWFLPDDPNDPDDVFAAAHMQYLSNDLIYNAIVLGMLDLDWDEAYTSPGEGYRADLANRVDYLGVNFYGTFVVSYLDLPPLYGLPRENPDPNVPKNECGTEIYPQGLFRVLEGFHRRYGHPILITENGLCDADDDQRLDFIVDHLRELARASSVGATLLGYCHWSLVDNFEWTFGYDPKFGLIEIDFTTQGRTVRPSALGYQAIIQAGEVP